jgi:hypothetical protein
VVGEAADGTDAIVRVRRTRAGVVLGPRDRVRAVLPAYQTGIAGRPDR